MCGKECLYVAEVVREGGGVMRDTHVFNYLLDICNACRCQARKIHGVFETGAYHISGFGSSMSLTLKCNLYLVSAVGYA